VVSTLATQPAAVAGELRFIDLKTLQAKIGREPRETGQQLPAFVQRDRGEGSPAFDA
jgi:hypothetical protein